MSVEKTRKIMNICTGMVVLAIMFFICIQNRGIIRASLAQRVHTINFNNAQAEFANIEQEYKNGFANRDRWINAYGIAQKALSRQITNDFTFIQDDYGMMHHVTLPNPELAKNCFVPDVCKLEEMVKQSGGEFLYIQGPMRERLRDCGWIEAFNSEDELADIVVSELRNRGIPVLDMTERMLEDNVDMSAENVFFNTDFHMETDAEFWAAREISSYITDQYHIDFPYIEWLYDMDLYNKATYPFVGNFCRDVGEVYEVVDDFDLYYPKTETHMGYYNMVNGSEAEGSFETICMNNFEGNNPNKFTYWVCDYLHYMEPYYKIVNHDVDGPKILILCDSIAYRTVAYMCLTSASITILDPRFYNGIDYTSMALEEDYDIVIVYQHTSLTYYRIFPTQ